MTINPHRITVIYATHINEAETAKVSFPEQTLSPQELQVIKVAEDDPYFPHKHSLEAISKVQGQYTVFLDSEDTFPSDFLRRMAESLAKSAGALAMSAQNCSLIQKNQDFFRHTEEKDLTVDTRLEPFIFPAELNGLMIKTDALKKLASSCLSSPEPEKLLLLRLLEEFPVFSYLGTLRLEYGYHRECDYAYDLRTFSHDWYYLPFEEFLLPLLQETENRLGYVPPLLQHLTLYMLHCRMYANINNRNRHVIPPKDVTAYAELFSRVLRFVDEATILSTSCAPSFSSPATKLLELRMKRRDYSYYPEFRPHKDSVALFSGELLFAEWKKLPVHILLMDYRDGCLEIDGSIYDFFSLENCAVYACLDGNRYTPAYNQRYSLTKCFGVTYARMKTFHVSVPVPAPDKERVLRFILCIGDREYPMAYAFPFHTSRFAKDFTYGYWRFGSCFSYWKKDGIHIIRSSKLLVLYKELRLWGQFRTIKDGKYRGELPLKMLNFLLRPYFSRRKIWLFFDKIYKGGDSSEYIYKYALKQKDGIRKYYLLDKHSADYQRLKKEGYKPLVRGSLKHRLVFLNASMVIASNSTVFAFNDYSFERSLTIRGDVHFDVACVQHGMSVQKIALAQQRLRDNTQLYFCASKYEIENLSKPIYDYAGRDILKLTGVPRYDGLKDRAQKVILLSPTWRMNSALPVTKNEGVERDYNPNFKETAYFKVYNSLINDPRLLRAAREHGYRIQYVLHPIVSPQYRDFTTNEYVEIIPATGDMSYEKVFCESALMVTDFSGVQFDFAYMRKPVIYLHHDDIPQHYENGTFYYDTMGFGEICHTNEELIDVLCRYMENGCKMPEKYRARADDFFAFSDNSNCERIYPIMLEHERNKAW